jgi:hypothetical protein
MSARLKIERAKQHINDLRVEIDKFLGTDPFVALGNLDPKTGEYVVTVAVREQPDRRLGVIAGDAAHNLRSGLDLAMWELDARPDDRTAFPICPTAQVFEALVKRMEQQQRWSARLARLLEGLKPYKGGDDALWTLHRIDITDKHRVLMVAGGAAEGVFLIDRSVPTDAWGRRSFPNMLVRPAFPLEDGAEILRLPLGSFDHSSVNMKPEFICEIAFAEPEIVKGKAILSTLTQLANYVEAVIKVISPRTW